MEYIILLGSNIGDRQKYIEDAIAEISDRCGHIIEQSKLYETQSWGFKAPPFLNKVIIVRSKLSPSQFLETTKEIEIKLGRLLKTAKQQTYMSRTIDIDIIFIDDMIIETPTLEVPHPRLHLRKFALKPIADIKPCKTHPIMNKTVSDLLGDCDDETEIKPYYGR